MEAAFRLGDAEHIVGIGASAGGLPALKELVSRFRCDSTAFVLVMHLSPSHKSSLAEILQRYSELRLATASMGVRVARNHIYVIPPHWDLIYESGILLLKDPGHELPRRPIDRLFRSLATAQGDRAIGVVLSGVGSDGAAGLAAIRGAGGLTLVQSPESAEFSGMPVAAQASAAHSLPPADLGDLLMMHFGVPPLPQPAAERLSASG